MKTQITITDKDGNKHVFDDIQDFKKKDVEVEPLYGRYNPGEGRAIYTIFQEDFEIFKVIQAGKRNPFGFFQMSFPTEQEAENHIEWLTLNDKILSIIEEDPWRPDWDDPDQMKWYVVWDNSIDKVRKLRNDFFQISGVQHMSEKTANRIIREFSEDDLYFWITKEKRGV